MSRKRKINFFKFNQKREHRDPRSSVNSKQAKYKQTNKQKQTTIGAEHRDTETLKRTTDKVIKAAREGKYTAFRTMTVIPDISSETVEVRGQWNDIFKGLKDNM